MDGKNRKYLNMDNDDGIVLYVLRKLNNLTK